jgi:hypothetical protein
MNVWEDKFETEEVSPQSSLKKVNLDNGRWFLYGFGRLSANDEWGIAWASPDYAVLKRGNILKRTRREGVCAGDIASNGTYLIGTGHEGATRLSGKCLIYDHDHQLLIKDSFGAGVFDVGIEPEGRYAVCQTCIGNVRGGLLSLYDIGMRGRLFQIETGSRWADRYAFDVGRQTLALIFHEGSTAYLSFKGGPI